MSFGAAIIISRHLGGCVYNFKEAKTVKHMRGPFCDKKSKVQSRQQTITHTHTHTICIYRRTKTCERNDGKMLEGMPSFQSLESICGVILLQIRTGWVFLRDDAEWGVVCGGKWDITPVSLYIYMYSFHLVYILPKKSFKLRAMHLRH